MTPEEFNIEIQKLFDLRENKKAGETLTVAESKQLGYFRDVLNAFYAAKNSVEGITREARKKLIAQYEEANALYLAKESGEPTAPPTPPVETVAPTLNIVTIDKLDPTNSGKYIRDAIAIGQDVDTATKSQEVSKQEGLVNEYAIIPNFIEELKNSIAQETDNTPVLAVDTTIATEVTDSGTSITLAETLKTDVAQIIAENELLIVTEHPLYVRGTGIYTDLESQLSIFNVKQDTLDTTTIFVDTEVNVYDLPETYLGEVQQQVLAVNKVTEEAFQAYQTALAAEQATAIESYSGGG
jgi:hypothetical protein